jgi:hypothetical protein
MNIDIGIRTAAKHAEYKRASGPLFEKYRLEYRKRQIDSLHCTCKRTGIAILGKSWLRNPILIRSLSKAGQKSRINQM